MTPLDVISLSEAKLFLRTDFDADDNLIETIIYAAVTYVEQMTNYRLYQRTEYKHSDGTYNVDVFEFPVNSIAVQTLDGTPVTWPRIKIEPIRRTVQFVRSSWNNAWTSNFGFGDGLDNGVTFYMDQASSLPLYNIVVNCGYTDTSLIPVTIIQAVKNIIVNMYENRDTSIDAIPNTVTNELQSYSRNPMF